MSGDFAVRRSCYTMIIRLYKYRECNEINVDNVKNGRCWFSPVKFMNDPFEAHICTTHLKLLKSAAISNAKRFGVDFETAMDAVVRAESNGEIDINGLLEELKTDVRNTFAAYCLSARWDSPVMWAHYASNYKGFCVGYDFDEAKNWHKPNAFQFPNNKFVGKVNYITNALDYLDERGNLLMKNLVNVLVSKHQDWQYEEEYRLAIEVQSGQGEVRSLPNQSLKEIIVGDKIDHNCLEKLKEIAVTAQVPIFKVSFSTKEFKIKKEEI